MTEQGRCGIFGGSFDPPHWGHVYVARQALKSLQLARLFVVPAANNPLKPGSPTTVKQRRDLAQLLVDELKTAELDLSQLEGQISIYTVDYLRHFKKRYPEQRPILIMGMDAWQSFHAWREAEAICELADIAVARRNGEVTSEAMLQPLRHIESVKLVCYDQGHYDTAAERWCLSKDRQGERTVWMLWLLPGVPPAVSSSEIRRRVANKQIIDDLAPAAIVNYIQQQQLY